jgi:hypothetical protein
MPEHDWNIALSRRQERYLRIAAEQFLAAAGKLELDESTIDRYAGTLKDALRKREGGNV